MRADVLYWEFMRHFHPLTSEVLVPNLYLVSAVFYLVTAFLMALDVALVNWGVIPGFSGMAWLRVHFVTLGFATQVFFGVLPRLQAARHNAPRPKTRVDIWMLLNLGLISLIAGIPIVNKAMILTGGTLVFIAAGVLAWHLRQIARSGELSETDWPRRFYGMGLLFLLTGIIVGTGYWLGWSDALKIASPIEVHVHANNWGFLSMVFAGLLFSIAPSLLKRPLASDKTAKIIFIGMTVGALGLVSGPWWGGTRAIPVSVAGLVIHMIITAVLVAVIFKAFKAAGALCQAGSWHVLLSYLWFFMPMFMAPIVVFHLGSIPGERIEGTAPQALVYGWIMQFGMATVPYFIDRYLLKSETPRLGGTWLSLLLVNVGSALIWLGIFIQPIDAILYGTAYLLLSLAALAVAVQMWQQVQSLFDRAEQKQMV